MLYKLQGVYRNNSGPTSRDVCLHFEHRDSGVYALDVVDTTGKQIQGGHILQLQQQGRDGALILRLQSSIHKDLGTIISFGLDRRIKVVT